MKNPIVALVEEELAWFEHEWTEDHEREPAHKIFPDKDNLYPIPFFGDIRSAEVLTVALNPAHDEFDQRHWPRRVAPNALNGATLTSRLVHYFDLPEPQPHPFFVPFSRMLLPIHSSYVRNAAHVDLSSLPTLKPKEMQVAEQRRVFVNKVTAFASRLDAVLRLAKRAKLLLILDFHVGNGMGRQMSIWQVLRESCQIIRPYADSNGSVLPVLVKRGTNGTQAIDEVTTLVSSMRHEIRDHLISGQPL